MPSKFSQEQREMINNMADPVPDDNLKKSDERKIVISDEDAKDDFREKRIGASEYAKYIIKLLSLGNPQEETFSLKKICDEWRVTTIVEKKKVNSEGKEETKIEEKERILRMAVLLSELEKINKTGEGAIIDVKVTFKSYR